MMFSFGDSSDDTDRHAVCTHIQKSEGCFEFWQCTKKYCVLSCGFANLGFYCLCINFQTQDPIVFDFKVEVSF